MLQLVEHAPPNPACLAAHTDWESNPAWTRGVSSLILGVKGWVLGRYVVPTKKVWERT